MVRSFGDYVLLGETKDDAAGEAYDKVSKLLGLGYPGGPVIDKLAKRGDPEAFRFPVPMKNRSEITFSYSGLKTAVLTEVKKIVKRGEAVPIEGICASFQHAAIESLVNKVGLAVRQTGISKIAISGGVAANSELRRRFLDNKNWSVFVPPAAYCTDNGVMIAAAGYSNFKRGVSSDLSLSPDPSWRLV